MLKLPLALRLARRDLRGGVRGLRLVVLCLALGVAAIAGVGSLRAAMDAGLAANGRVILGGDLEIGTGAQPPPPALLAWLAARGARVSQLVQMRSLLVAPSGERQLVELRAVDRAWPLVGAPELDPAMPVQQALAERDGLPGLMADPVVLDRLKLKPGDTARLGTATFRITTRLVAAPDRVSGPVILGAPVIISEQALARTGLDVPGALVSRAVRVVSDDPNLATEVQAAFPNQGWRIRTPRDAAPGVGRFIDQAALFLTLVGFTALLVGGIGVANGVRAWLAARGQTVAILRCLGASSGLVLAVCLSEVMALAGLGIAIGMAVGAAIPAVSMGWLQSVLPVPPEGGVYIRPLILAAAYGVLIALVFALWPLGQATRMPSGTLFRGAGVPERGWPGAGVAGVTAVLGAGIVALAALGTDHWFALWFCAAAAATLLLYFAGAKLLVRAVRALPSPRGPGLRLGIGGLHRPGAPTPQMLVSIGLGLSVLACVAVIQANLRQQIGREIPRGAPSFYFVDIQPDQVAPFEALVKATPGMRDLALAPSLRARIVAVNGVPADQVQATPQTRWALRGDRGLTYAATPPPGTRLVAGSWWPAGYRDKPLVSMDAGIASGWGVGVGSTIRVNVLGRDIDLTVASLRQVAWQRLGLNFVMVASPGLLEAAPHTAIATVIVPEQEQGALLRRVSDALPNVTGIAVQGVLADIAGLLDELAAVLSAAGLLTLIAGGLVLIGAIAAGQQRRLREAVILKTLGATRAQLRMAWLAEFGVLGLTAGVLAAVVGAVSSWAVMRYLMHAAWGLQPEVLGATLIIALLLMLIIGYAATAAVMGAKAAPVLRNE